MEVVAAPPSAEALKLREEVARLMQENDQLKAHKASKTPRGPPPTFPIEGLEVASCESLTALNEIHAQKHAPVPAARPRFLVAPPPVVAPADTEGQTCPICLEATHVETNEGLTRMCACHGIASCEPSVAPPQPKRRIRGCGKRPYSVVQQGVKSGLWRNRSEMFCMVCELGRARQAIELEGDGPVVRRTFERALARLKRRYARLSDKARAGVEKLDVVGDIMLRALRLRALANRKAATLVMKNTISYFGRNVTPKKAALEVNALVVVALDRQKPVDPTVLANHIYRAEALRALILPATARRGQPHGRVSAAPQRLGRGTQDLDLDAPPPQHSSSRAERAGRAATREINELFAQDNRAAVCAEYPGDSEAAVRNRLREMWRSADETTREAYVDRAKTLCERARPASRNGDDGDAAAPAPLEGTAAVVGTGSLDVRCVFEVVVNLLDDQEKHELRAVGQRLKGANGGRVPLPDLFRETVALVGSERWSFAVAEAARRQSRGAPPLPSQSRDAPPMPAAVVSPPTSLPKATGRGRWTTEEHDEFLKCLDIYGLRDEVARKKVAKGLKWMRVAEHITTRTPVQIRSHAQNYFKKIEASKSEAVLNGGPGWIGAYSPEARKRRVARFHGKRARRVWTKRVGMSA